MEAIVYNGADQNQTAVIELQIRIGKWVEGLSAVPGWNEYNRRKISNALWFGEDDLIEREPLGDFIFDNQTQSQHNIIMAYLELRSSFEGLQMCEYYFRRYPFRGLPVNRFYYLRDCCELYFNKFYEIKERIKNLGDKVNTVSQDMNIGPLIKQYSKIFSEELKQRNLVHHHNRFDDVQLDKIYLLSLRDDDNSISGRASNSYSSYKQVCREWVLRVRNRNKQMEIFAEAIAKGMLHCCEFLPQE